VTTTFLFVRHAAHDSGLLLGREKDVGLGETGRAQAKRLGVRLACGNVDVIFTSPRERAVETAAAIVSARGNQDAMLAEALDEVDFGSWSGRTLAELGADPAWRRWNEVRSLCRAPGGESMLDVQQRVLSFLEQVTGQGSRRLIFVTHAEVIRAAVSYYLGLSIDAWPRFEISPASITTVVVGEWGAKLTGLNEVDS
jgi:broad specificity phosphatase PhoE